MPQQKSVPVFAHCLLANVLGIVLGVLVGSTLFPQMGELGDAARPALIVAAGLFGCMLSGIYTALLLIRRG